MGIQIITDSKRKGFAFYVGNFTGAGIAVPFGQNAFETVGEALTAAKAVSPTSSNRATIYVNSDTTEAGTLAWDTDYIDLWAAPGVSIKADIDVSCIFTKWVGYGARVFTTAAASIAMKFTNSLATEIDQILVDGFTLESEVFIAASVDGPTIRFRNCKFISNSVTGGNATLSMLNSNDSVVEQCEAYSGTSNNNHCILASTGVVNFRGKDLFLQSRSVPGSFSTACFKVQNGASGIVRDSRFEAVGTISDQPCISIDFGDFDFINCDSDGGAAVGCLLQDEADANLIDCRISSTSTHAVNIAGTVDARFKDCEIFGGYLNNNRRGINAGGGPRLEIDNCIVTGGVKRFTEKYTYTAATAATVTPSLLSGDKILTGFRIQMNVGVKPAETVTITIAPDTIAGPVNLSTSLIALPVDFHKVFSTSFAVVVTGGVVDGDFTLTYVYESARAADPAIFLNGTDGDFIMRNSVLRGNSQSQGMLIATGTDLTQIRIVGCSFASGLNDISREDALESADVWAAADIYQCSFDGGTTNVTASAGTANGSNIEF